MLPMSDPLGFDPLLAGTLVFLAVLMALLIGREHAWPERFPGFEGRRFIVTAGTAYDTTTGLTWEYEPRAVRCTWDEARDYCATLRLGEQADWRVPTISELVSVIDYAARGPACVRVLPTESAPYWSATSVAGAPSCAWLADFTDGYLFYGAKGGGYYVRAVRGNDKRWRSVRPYVRPGADQ